MDVIKKTEITTGSEYKNFFKLLCNLKPKDIIIDAWKKSKSNVKLEIKINGTSIKLKYFEDIIKKHHEYIYKSYVDDVKQKARSLLHDDLAELEDKLKTSYEKLGENIETAISNISEKIDEYQYDICHRINENK